MSPKQNITTAPALLALADGTIFHGESFGAPVTITGEVVFNTSLTGYQEILTDPSYCGQIVTMTYPHIGNVGVNPHDVEAGRPWAAGLIVREVSRRVSNYRATQSLPEYLQENNLPGLTEVDTRALVRHIRTQGAMMAALSADPALSAADLVDIARTAPSMEGLDLAKVVTCAEPYHWDEGVIAEWRAENTYQVSSVKYHVVAYDFGIKHNILRLLSEAGCRVTIVPANTPAEDVLALNPNGIFLSNGPGDPAAVTYAIKNTKKLVEENLPIFGICLGHQILGLALGGATHKMKFGHRGGNQPVKDVTPPLSLPVEGTKGGALPPVEENRGGVAITSHNHGFAVSAGSLPEDVEVTHINLNDGCIEGLRHKTKPIFSIQYHPESSPGPHDALAFFKQFAELMAQ